MSDTATQASGWGLISRHLDGQVLDAWFPSPQLGRTAQSQPPAELAAAAHRDELRRVATEPLLVTIDLNQAPQDVADAYLRLHLLSHRLVPPHGLNLDGLFGVLPNNAWTNLGPIPPALLPSLQLALRARGGQLQVFGVDKFPRMTDYVVPSEVRIADADRVRLGAHLAPGTTVMHEGFVNFNAGTLGTSMIEGRISAGVVVGAGSDVGGGASIMGTLSGGGNEVIRLGERCLLGAESGIGISLGDDCIVEAGLYLTAGTKVGLPDGSIVKAAELSGQSGWLFLRDSVTGQVIAKSRGSRAVALNDELHTN